MLVIAMLVIPRGTTSELPTFGITNPVSWNSQLVGNFDLKSFGITNNSELPIFGIFNRNTECEPGYGLRYGLKYGLGYGLKYKLWVRVWVRVWG